MPNEQEVERMKSLSKQNEYLIEEEESSYKIESEVEHEWHRSESTMNSPDPRIHEEEYVHANMYKDLDLYLSAKNGDLADFKRIIHRISTGDSEDDLLSRLSLIGNTFLHVAAKHGNQDIVKFIASTKPSLVSVKNICGETVLHLAAKGGHEAMVEALVGILSHNETEKSALLMAENEMGNTALDQALISGWESVASFFIQQDSELSYHLNKHGESALYLAAKAGLVECISSILVQCTDDNRLNLLFKNKSSIQAAIERKDIVVLEAIINAKPRLIQMRDNEGRNPLHFAASLGHLKAAHYLLQIYPFNATRRDKKGKLPIHLAALEGHVDIICALLQDIPEADDLLDKSGRNILHIAARSGRYKVSITQLLYSITYLSVWLQRLIWAALKAVSVPQPISYRKGSTRMVSGHMEVYKERVNTLLVVATLVATVTFAAGFTMPGGYISSETGTDLGMATMWRDAVFQIFVLCDTIGMYSSILAVTALIWAQLGDTTFVVIALQVAAPLLGVALIMMSMAFTAGVTIILNKLRWLQITMLAMSTSFIVLLLVLLLPLCAPLSSRSLVLRKLYYYPFCLLVYSL
ncbi:protein ACCELERATED CELL DEATH 6-like [Salvia splendens]|uniref:protein ACCELERATED CELL DEATH 6-like n=1 Tax=Salvia splendens TaxID=180675 RepID=UPI001C268578|nr:protein ACCELERATED CELL DEATH 6-like [Salvia splendens]